jgi:hypothetical protein
MMHRTAQWWGDIDTLAPTNSSGSGSSENNGSDRHGSMRILSFLADRDATISGKFEP